MEQKEKDWILLAFALNEEHLIDGDEEITPAGKVREYRKKMAALLKKKPKDLFWDLVINADFEEWLKTAGDGEVYEKK